MSKKSKAIRSLAAPIYGYWQALYLSFYSRALYVDVVKRWRGFGIIYLLLVFALAAIPLSLRVMADLRYYFDEQLILPLKLIPPLTVQNGAFSFDKPMPYFLKNKKGEVVTIIDTTGTVTQMDNKYPSLTILITKNEIYFHPPKLKLFIPTLSSVKDPGISKQTLDKNDNEIFVGEEWINAKGIYNLKLISIIVIYPLILLFFFAVYLVFMFTLAFMGQIFASVLFNLKLKYMASCRLLVIAATPQILLVFAMLAMNVLFFGVGYFYMALIALYFSFGVVSVKREYTQMARL